VLAVPKSMAMSAVNSPLKFSNPNIRPARA
jgi:hypothetical protein